MAEVDNTTHEKSSEYNGSESPNDYNKMNN